VGGLLVICSDAAPEAEDPQGTPFGDLRLRELVARVRNADADGIPNIIINALNDWRGGKALEDDLTVLALKRTKARD
jgi:sigma-B regulation protein RsbU (phosphoserine phosphatase)